MKKRVSGRQLKRDFNERKALFKSLMSALILEEQIKTTEAKAKAIKGEIERFVTKAKDKEEFARYHLSKHFRPEVVNKMIKDIAPRFKERPGGYTRILRIGNRVKDNASMVILQWVEGQKKPEVQSKAVMEDKKDIAKKSDMKDKKVEKRKKNEIKKEVSPKKSPKSKK